MKKCGIVSTSCVAAGLDVMCWWVQYHLKLGVSRIYLFIHDARAPTSTGKTTSGAVQARHLVSRVRERIDVDDVRICEATHDTDIVALQERHATEAIEAARQDGLDWLFHIDDDELLYLTEPGACGEDALSRAFDDVDDQVFNLRIDNLEVQKVTRVGDSTYNFFEEEKLFKLRVGLHADGSKVARYHDPRFYVHGGNPATGGDGHTAPYLSYWNGKSCGRLKEPGLKPCGVHFFASARGDAANAGAQQRATRLVLLHYPFCHFATWRHKFNVLDASQRSDWGHYREARLAIVEALAPGGAGESGVDDFYRRTVAGGGTGEQLADEDDAEERLALYMPPCAAPQEWRSGAYFRNVDGVYELDAPNANLPSSYVYNVPDTGMWLVGSTPGATTGAAVAYDAADHPADVRAQWSVYDGTQWSTADVAIGAIATRCGRRFAVIDASEVLSGVAQRRAKSTTPKPATTTTTTSYSGPDHAKLAAVVLLGLETHTPYRDRFWEAVAAAAGREPSGDVADTALRRALAAGARCMGAPPVAAKLVAERLSASHAHSDELRDAVAQARQLRARLLGKHADRDCVQLTVGLDCVQSWRTGLYAFVEAQLYQRVKDRGNEQDSFLFAVPSRGMWLVGSTPGSTTGGLVAYDRATRPHDLKAPWHVYDGQAWVQAPAITVKPVSGGTRQKPQAEKPPSAPTMPTPGPSSKKVQPSDMTPARSPPPLPTRPAKRGAVLPVAGSAQ